MKLVLVAFALVQLVTAISFTKTTCLVVFNDWDGKYCVGDARVTDGTSDSRIAGVDMMELEDGGHAAGKEAVKRGVQMAQATQYSCFYTADPDSLAFGRIKVNVTSASNATAPATAVVCDTFQCGYGVTRGSAVSWLNNHRTNTTFACWQNNDNPSDVYEDTGSALAGICSYRGTWSGTACDCSKTTYIGDTCNSSPPDNTPKRNTASVVALASSVLVGALLLLA
eukprot:TRINITY_DN351_c0_g1_i1.p1 TRINITY_DN351_c0_g1~~TRINITY_DN351_c0_g1_i1.p1  ORF type:complete len:225 (-),score=65.25 TRINITY_DN351_c0_g1_i1:132-806(-)